MAISTYGSLIYLVESPVSFFMFHKSEVAQMAVTVLFL